MKGFRLALSTIFLAGLVTSACLGDRSATVIVTNETTRKVTVYPYGRQRDQVKWVLEPGGVHKDDMLAGDARPDTPVARMEAVDDSGALVFCHMYTYGELKGLDGAVRIKEGKNDCT